MASAILFEEVQATTKKAYRDFVWGLTMIFIVALIFNLVMQRGAITELTKGLLTILVIVLISAVFTNMKMVTRITEEGIAVRYAPFQPAFAYYAWQDIDRAYIRKFDPITEYNGWGIKSGPSGRAYTVAGNTGLQVIFHDGTKLLISTQRPDEIQALLNHLHHKV
jgi:hypothetical protein